MLFAMLLLSAAANWVPMRWTAADPTSLGILKGTPVNCLLLEKAAINQKTVEAAGRSGIETLAVVNAGATEEQIQGVSAMKMKGVVFEGDYAPDAIARLRKVAADSGLLTIDLPPRAKMRFDSTLPLVGTYEGVWPGIRVEEEGAAKAAPAVGHGSTPTADSCVSCALQPTRPCGSESGRPQDRWSRLSDICKRLATPPSSERDGFLRSTKTFSAAC